LLIGEDQQCPAEYRDFSEPSGGHRGAGSSIRSASYDLKYSEDYPNGSNYPFRFDWHASAREEKSYDRAEQHNNKQYHYQFAQANAHKQTLPLPLVVT
jgi:hypothetical protein